MTRRQQHTKAVNDLWYELYQRWAIFGHQHEKFNQIIANLRMRNKKLIKHLWHNRSQIWLQQIFHIHINSNDFDNNSVIVKIFLYNLIQPINNRLQIMPKRMWVLTGKCVKQTQRQFQIVDLPQCTLQGLIDILFDIALL